MNVIERITHLCVMVVISYLLTSCQALQTNILLQQGPIMGLKIFPDSSRDAVYAYLGIPYAQPPVLNLRFAPPQPNSGWNQTLQAMSMKPICPQLTNTVYDETDDGKAGHAVSMDEDCLYLNVWVPETGSRFNNLPVLAIITGEEMAFDWPHYRVTGVDLASDGIIVVSIQYRSNIFGWIGLGTRELPGNYGLQDQELALLWIQDNIQKFGGNPNQVTLLGHGTSGAPCVMAHWLSANHPNSFSQIALMSGSDMEAILNDDDGILKTSQLLVQKLGCHFEERRNQLVSCLRAKSINDLQKAFESVYDNGNSSTHLGPIIKTKLEHLLQNQTLVRLLPPMVIGITSNEGAFLRDYWLELAHEGYQFLHGFINYTVLPSIMRQTFKELPPPVASHIRDILTWRYFSGEASVNLSHLLSKMQRLISESMFETPFYKILELLAMANSTARDIPIYAYIFDISYSMDMRGKINLFGGASHSSDLPFLLGPSMFQQIARRRFSADEERVCRKVRAAFVNFVKNGNPTPGRIYDAWLPYNSERKFIFNLGEDFTKNLDEDYGSLKQTGNFIRNIPQIEKMIQGKTTSNNVLMRLNHNENQQYDPAGLGVQSNVEDRRVKANSYLKNQLDSGYVLHLKRVSSFWEVLLPKIAAFKSNDFYPLEHRIRYMEATADASRYKRGFFALLVLVSVLLSILGLCVYLLRRDSCFADTLDGAIFIAPRQKPSTAIPTALGKQLNKKPLNILSETFTKYQIQQSAKHKKTPTNTKNDKSSTLKETPTTLKKLKPQEHQVRLIEKLNVQILKEDPEQTDEFQRGHQKQQALWTLKAANSDKTWLLKTGNTN